MSPGEAGSAGQSDGGRGRVRGVIERSELHRLLRDSG